MMHFAKTVLCAACKYSGAAAAQELLLRALGRSYMTILLFHRVTDDIPEDGLTVSTVRFRSICRMLRRGFRVVPLAEMFRIVRVGAPVPHRTVAITFDDCYRDNLGAAHILAEMGLPACFFIPTGFVGTSSRFEWDDGLGPLPNLTWDDVRAMARLGFEIGSHTVTHPNMALVPQEEARRELVESKAVLEERLGQPVRWFAYPFGGRKDFTAARLPLVREAGYDGCVSGYGGFITHGADAELLPREAVPYFRNTLNLELYLSGGLRWYYALKRCLRPQDHAEMPSRILRISREALPGKSERTEPTPYRPEVFQTTGQGQDSS